jgi:hypothetical protein
MLYEFVSANFGCLISGVNKRYELLYCNNKR